MKWYVPDNPIAVYSISPKLRDDDYRYLLDIVSTCCTRFSLISGIPTSQRTSESQRSVEFAKQMSPYLLEEERVMEWPSTKVIGSVPSERQPIMRVYAVTCPALEIVKRTRPSLFHWLGPAFPEDPTFYADDGRCVLVTCSHEGGAELYVPDHAMDLIQKCEPLIARGLVNKC